MRALTNFLSFWVSCKTRLLHPVIFFIVVFRITIAIAIWNYWFEGTVIIYVDSCFWKLYFSTVIFKNLENCIHFDIITIVYVIRYGPVQNLKITIVISEVNDICANICFSVREHYQISRTFIFLYNSVMYPRTIFFL